MPLPDWFARRADAGAGVRGGQVIGRTDRDGGYVFATPYTPGDYASTIYEKLGIDRAKPIFTSSNRPVYFGHLGEPIPGIVREHVGRQTAWCEDFV